MNNRRNIFFLLALFCTGSCILFGFEKQRDGILFELKKPGETDARWLKIQVCTENIIRVIAVQDTPFSKRPSLMTDRTQWAPVPWSVKTNAGDIEISTAKVTVRVNSLSGAVAFYSPQDRLLLHEKTGGGKIITAAEAMGEQTFHIRQFFDSPDDEAFYGLGGHQNSIMNYKGHDVDLWQYNIVKSIPFLVSSRNYGILWDNNSRTKFGDIREYQSLSGLALYGKDGRPGGLTAEYFKDSAMTSLFTSRPEPRIEHEFIDVNDAYPPGFEKNAAAIRWSGEIESRESGLHKFRLYCCGYTKMWLDDSLVVDSWRQNWLPWTHFPCLSMRAGERHRIRIEWIHTGGYIGLKYLPPEQDTNSGGISLFSEVADQIDYYFIAGNNTDDVVHGYREITGRAPMMPKWAMGLWQSREHYNTQDEILSVVKEFRNHRIPLDNIVQDWFYWKEDDWGDHEFDPARYADPGSMIQTLHDSLHTNIMISVWAKFYVGTKNYEEFKNHDWLYMRNVEKGQKDWVGPGYVSTYYDPYQPQARDLFWKQIDEKLFSKGIDAWWLDCSEPDIQSNLSRQEAILRQGPTALGSSARYQNSFSLMHCKGVYEGQLRSDSSRRVFILTRSAFAGLQRYSAAVWSGDVAARWYDLKTQISSGLNFCLSGIPYWTTDIGGFAVESRYEHPSDSDRDEWRELTTRWFQFGTFCPLLRVHGQFPYREMFNVAPENHPAYQSMLMYDKLRYRLLPYIYSLAGMVTQDDYTIMRPLVMDFGSDAKVLNIGDQYMFGPALLVNPVTEYKARTRSVYLPAGNGWYDFRSGDYFEGGQTIRADAPYSVIPLFVKAGSLIPCGPEIQYTTEKQADTLRLFVYTGADGNFNLYEDENINNNYKKGEFSIIPIQYQEKERTLTIGKRQGTFPGMLYDRTIEIVRIGKEKPIPLEFASKPDIIFHYDGYQHTIELK
jgi:alpha-D-xyloside xylohydrolase